MGVILNRAVFQQAWTGFLRVVANQYDLKVVYGGAPRTDGETIWLPQLPMVLTEDDTFLVKTHGHHEIAHCLYTDFTFGRKFSALHGQGAFGLLNALEDARIETRHISVSGSAEHYLREKPTRLLAAGRFNSGEGSSAMSYMAYCLCYLQQKNWNTYTRPTSIAFDNFVEVFGEGAEDILDKTRNILDIEFPFCRETSDVGNLVLRLRDMLRKEAEKPNDGEDSSKAQGQGDDSNGSESGSSSSSEDQQSQGSKDNTNTSSESDDSGSSNDNQNSDSSSDNVDKSGETDESTSGNEQSSAPEEGPSLAERVELLLNENPGDEDVFDIKKAVIDLADDIEDGKKPEYEGVPLVPSGEFGGQSVDAGDSFVDGDPIITPMNVEHTQTIMGSLGCEAQTLSAYLQQMLLSTDEADVHVGRRGGLMTSRLYRAGMGDVNLFAQVEDVEAMNTSVLMLNDLSGSTGGDCAIAIQQSSMVLAQALDLVQVPFEIMGFGHKKHSLIAEVKHFEERFLSCKQRIGGMNDIVGGGTPLTEAVFEAGQRLAARSEHRRIMYVLTDGYPSDTSACAEQINWVRSQGIEVLVLLLGKRTSSAWLSSAEIPYANIPSVIQLPTVILQKMQQSLFG